jgi:hypothetical protein
MKKTIAAALILLTFACQKASAQFPGVSPNQDYFHDDLHEVATKFTALQVPDLEKIQLPQLQPDGSFIFVYIWLPQTHRPTTSTFEANIADFLDIIGAQSAIYDGWCYLREPETTVAEKDGRSVGAMRISVLGYFGKPPARCEARLPGDAGKLGQTQIIRDPGSGMLSMMRQGYPTRFPNVVE